MLFKEEGGRRRQRQNKKEGERLRHLGVHPQEIIRKKNAKKKRLSAKIFIRTMATERLD